jgi:hypothetical protein
MGSGLIIDGQRVLVPGIDVTNYARWFLDLAIAFGREYPSAPALMDSGWAALLSLFNIR